MSTRTPTHPRWPCCGRSPPRAPPSSPSVTPIRPSTASAVPMSGESSEFPDQFRDANGRAAPVVVLNRTRRFGTQIRAVADRWIEPVGLGALPREARESHRKAPVRWPAGQGGGAHVPDLRRAAAGVADALRRAHLDAATPVPWSDMAVIVRSGADIPRLRLALLQAGVPSSSGGRRAARGGSGVGTPADGVAARVTVAGGSPGAPGPSGSQPDMPAFEELESFLCSRLVGFTPPLTLTRMMRKLRAAEKVLAAAGGDGEDGGVSSRATGPALGRAAGGSAAARCDCPRRSGRRDRALAGLLTGHVGRNARTGRERGGQSVGVVGARARGAPPSPPTLEARWRAGRLAGRGRSVGARALRRRPRRRPARVHRRCHPGLGQPALPRCGGTPAGCARGLCGRPRPATGAGCAACKRCCVQPRLRQVADGPSCQGSAVAAGRAGRAAAGQLARRPGAGGHARLPADRADGLQPPVATGGSRRRAPAGLRGSHPGRAPAGADRHRLRSRGPMPIGSVRRGRCAGPGGRRGSCAWHRPEPDPAALAADLRRRLQDRQADRGLRTAAPPDSPISPAPPGRPSLLRCRPGSLVGTQCSNGVRVAAGRRRQPGPAVGQRDRGSGPVLVEMDAVQKAEATAGRSVALGYGSLVHAVAAAVIEGTSSRLRRR